MNTAERTLYNSGIRCTVTGARNLSTVLKLVLEAMEEEGIHSLSVADINTMIDGAVDKYEVVQMRKLK